MFDQGKMGDVDNELIQSGFHPLSTGLARSTFKNKRELTHLYQILYR